MRTDFVIPEDVYPLATLQRGELWDLEPDREAWTRAYHDDLLRTLGLIAVDLPLKGREPIRVCDVGSGIGGIDLMIHRYFESVGVKCTLTLVDRLGGRDHVEFHGKPFGSLIKSRAFLEANGVARDDITCLDCDRLAKGTFDLVISTRAWFFHFGASPYLGWVKKSLDPEAKVIIDMRRGRPEWRAEVVEAFGKPREIAQDGKSELLVFSPK